MTTTSVVYVLSVKNNEINKLYYDGDIEETDSLLSTFNSSIINIDPDKISLVRYSDSFRKLQSIYSINSVFLSSVFSTIETEVFLVCLSRDESLFAKSICEKISLTIPMLSDYFSKNSAHLVENNPITNLNEKYDFVIQNSDDIIFTLNEHGNFNEINLTGARSLGYNPSEILGKHLMDLISDEDKPTIVENISKILTDSDLFAFELPLIDKHKKKIVFKLISKQIFEDENLIGVFCYGKNVANLIRNKVKIEELREKYKEANRLIEIEKDRAKQQISVLEELNKLKNDFIANVSHELRTPLASIVGYSETITSDPDLPKEMINEFINIILVEGKRLSKLINDILDFSKFEAGEKIVNKSIINLSELLKELHQVTLNFTNEKELQFNLEVPKIDIEISGDRENLIQAFSNVLDNAIKFTNRGGRISIIVNDFVKEVEIIISDTGIGIPKEQIPNLLQKFTKLNRPGQLNQGMGFGLATVKRIVDLHKGMVKIKSDLDQGTSVIIRLPKNIKNTLE